MKILAGIELYERLQAEKTARVAAGMQPGTFKSDELCTVQTEQARRGVLGVHLVKSLYGWSVRYDSGLQNFGIVASARARQLDGTYEAARAFAQSWVEKDPARRYAWISDYDAGKIESTNGGLSSNVSAEAA